MATGDGKTAPPADDRTPDGTCMNCGAVLAGPYCHVCGQEDEPRVVPFRRAMGEFLGDVSNLDSRVYRTLKLLVVRPGALTLEYVRGRRVRYLPPLRLYLAASVIYFALAALIAPGRVGPVVTGDAAGRRVGSLAAREDSARAAPGEAAGADTTAGAGGGQYRLSLPGVEAEARGSIPGPIQAFLRRAAEDPEGVNRAVRAMLPRLMFLLVPAFAWILRGIYARSGAFYVQHLVFALHLHTVAFLLLAMGLVGDRLVGPKAGDPFSTLAMIAIWVYAFLALRRVFGGSRRRTLAKFVVLALGYLALFVVVLLAATVITVFL